MSLNELEEESPAHMRLCTKSFTRIGQKNYDVRR